MSKARSQPDGVLSSRERAVMRVLWDEGPATAEQIRQGLPVRLSNSSVRTFLRILERKGHIKHAKRGRAFIFQPQTPRDQAVRQAVDDLLNGYFDGSFEALASWYRAGGSTRQGKPTPRRRSTGRSTKHKRAAKPEAPTPETKPTTDVQEPTEPWLL